MWCLLPGDWEHWTKRVEEYIYPPDSVPEFSSILVPNVDNVRTNFLIDTIAKQHKVSHNPLNSRLHNKAMSDFMQNLKCNGKTYLTTTAIFAHLIYVTNVAKFPFLVP